MAPLLDTDVDFGAVTDSGQHAGRLRQQITYDGSQPIASTFKNYTYRQTGIQSAPGADQPSRWVRDTVTYTSTQLTATNSWRTHVVTKRYDTLGMVTSVDDYGQKGLGGDEICTRNWYARYDDAGITSLSYAKNSPATLADPTGLDPSSGLKCGHPGEDQCGDPDVYCYGENPDGTADITGPVPGSGGAANDDAGTSITNIADPTPAPSPGPDPATSPPATRFASSAVTRGQTPH
ncbi:hypothetical protein [Streptomyces swartbergensis]|nr:hypothetical protein [Streptomyces swartbergensis]